MKDLIRLLKIAHAVEIGAYQAYGGHWKSLPSGRERFDVWMIQCEELIHRNFLAKVLEGFGYKTNKFYDTTVWIIGTTIGFACYLFPRRAAMWGAKVMEILGSDIYYKLADAAWDLELKDLTWKFLEMADNEEKHERYFRYAAQKIKKS